jgi:SAM-dependent methyltransferase
MNSPVSDLAPSVSNGDLAAWLATPQGRYVLDWELARMDQVSADIFGFNALQIGLPQVDFLRANRIPFRFLSCAEPGAPVRASPEQLPFSAHSIDLVMLPHVLEFAANPHQILREVERVLVPEGHVLIAGFNPFSLWGAKRSMMRGQGPVPWCGTYLSVRRLKDWLALLGFETQAGAFGCYVPAVVQEKWLMRWRFMAAAGDRWWPFAGAVYVVQAIKRVPGMRLIQPKWKDARARARALAPVARRHEAQHSSEANGTRCTEQ